MPARTWQGQGTGSISFESGASVNVVLTSFLISALQDQ